MKIPPKLKKWIRGLVILLSFLFALGGSAYYLLVHHFKELVQVVVQKQSKGRYTFDASGVKVSLFSRRIELNDISINCTDTLHTAAHYAIRVPRIYLSIESVRDLLFHKKISVDSMAVMNPEITAHIHHPPAGGHGASFSPPAIMEALQQLGQHLQIRSFKLANAAFSYSTLTTVTPFAGSHINLSITNFSKKDTVQHYLFCTADIDLLITDQYWKMPDGLHEAGFKKLHFSGKNPYFEIDSCTLVAKAGPHQNPVSLTAGRLLIRSGQLQDIYEKDELVIDTVLLDTPVLRLQTTGGQGPDTAGGFATAFQRLFSKISFRYIDIKDGRFALNNQNNLQPTYTSQQTNLRLFGLSVSPGHKPGIRADSIQVKLGQVKFITKDSLFQLTVSELALNKDILILKNTRYGPTPHNRQPGNMVFTTPALYLHNISLEDLINKRLTGTLAEIYHPVITLSGPAKPQNNNDTSAATGRGNFYTTLHGLSELVNVDSFHIIDGNIHFQSHDNTVRADLNAINGVVLMDRFLHSDSLIDIKRALPDLRVNSIAVQTPALQLLAKDYQFNGTFRHSTINWFRISLANQNTFTGKQLYWEIFDWDIYQQTKKIQIENFRLAELHADIKTGNEAGKNNTPRPLPVISIARFDLGQLTLALQAKNDATLQIKAQAICLDQIGSKDRFLTWNNIMAQVSAASFHNSQTTARIENAVIDNQYQTVVQGASVEINNGKGSATFNMPIIKLVAPLHSSGFSRLRLDSLAINDAVFHYRGNKDSIDLKGRLHLLAGNIQAGKQGIGLLNVSVQSNGLAAVIKRPDSSVITGDDFSVAFNTPRFSFEKGDKINWRPFIAHTLISNGNIVFRNNHLSAGIAGLRWNGPHGAIHTGAFYMEPRLSMDESFARATWQSDYITVKGNSIDLEGLQLHRLAGDSLLEIRKLALSGLSLLAARDKRIPFKHGTEKRMPTDLLGTIRFPFRIDSLLLQQSAITVHEVSVLTNKKGIIPLQHLDALVTNIKNRPVGGDTLYITAGTRLLNNQIDYFRYSESYTDSLSSFTLQFHTSPMVLTAFSDATVPLAAIRVNSGNADTLYASWTGNKYAAIGKMNFHYRGLSVRLLDKNEPARKKFRLSVMNFLANSLVLHKKNTRESMVFYERNREKFVFNYWVKTSFSGLLSSIGIKGNRKYYKAYRKVQNSYSLPKNL